MLLDRRLLVRMPNWVGDAVMALPALSAFSAAGFEVTLWGKPWLSDLLFGSPYEVQVYPARLLDAVRALRQMETQPYVLFTNSLSSALVGRLAGKQPYGYRTDGRRCCLSASLKKMPGQHEVEYFWNMAQFAIQCLSEQRMTVPRRSEQQMTAAPPAKQRMGGRGMNERPIATQFAANSDHVIAWPTALPRRLTFPASTLSALAQEDQTAQTRLITAGISGPYWVICPTAAGCATRGVAKVWPHWRAWFDAVSSRALAEGVRIMACPLPNEYTWVKNQFPNTLTCLSDVSLLDYMRLLRGAQLVVGNDTGPLHLATALGTTVLGIYGVTDPRRTAPWGGHYVGELGQWPSVETVCSAIDHLLSLPCIPLQP